MLSSDLAFEDFLRDIRHKSLGIRLERVVVPLEVREAVEYQAETDELLADLRRAL